MIHPHEKLKPDHFFPIFDILLSFVDISMSMDNEPLQADNRCYGLSPSTESFRDKIFLDFYGPSFPEIVPLIQVIFLLILFFLSSI